jgi:hypothetical protein
VNVTVLLESEQPDESLAKLRTTTSPEVADAPGEYEPRALPAAGAVLTVMMLDAYTLIDCSTSAAGAYVVLPGSLKVISHSPAPVKVTFPELNEQPDESLYRAITTWSLEVAWAWGT